MFDPGQPGAAPLTPGGSVPVPGSVAAAVAMAESALAYLASADLASVPVETQAECLRGLARVEALHLVARSDAVSAFCASGGYEADGQYSAQAWLRWQTRVTRRASTVAVSWARQLDAHPAVRAALTALEISASWAQQICKWTDALPDEVRADADAILLAAAAGGADLTDLAGLAEEMFRRCAPPDTDQGKGFEDRSLCLDLTIGGAGRLVADLTPGCAAGLAAMLEALGKKAGPEDTRTQPQRHHDALEEAARRLAGSSWLPDRAGQPTQVQVHLTLDQLRGSDGGPEAEAAWAAGRAAADGAPGWILDPAAADGYACDAHLAPIVTGHVDRVALALAVRTFMTATRKGPCPIDGCTPDGCRQGNCAAGGARGGLPMTFNELQDLFLRQAIEVLSGPTGLAAHLRAVVGGPAGGGVSLPLDVGAVTPTIPPHLRRAVITRDRHCAFPGCHQPPAACQVHHIIPRSQDGTTSLTNLVLLCPLCRHRHKAHYADVRIMPT
jgi:Domain of unknown function (DUF222)/HNH endonuclease